MAVIGKSVSITMASGNNNKTVIHCGGLLKGEVPAVRGALDTTELYKSVGYSVVTEDEALGTDAFTLPAAVVMTGKRDKTLQIKLTNDTGQNLFLGLECPVNFGDMTDLNAFVQTFDKMNIAGFGTVKEALLDIK